jgi:epidermal growth factor receptor
MVLNSDTVRTLGMKKLKSIEKGDVYFKASRLCLDRTINWSKVLKTDKLNGFASFNRDEATCRAEGYVCDSACDGCWGLGPTACQFCRTFKLNGICVNSCNAGDTFNNSYIYVENEETRECNFCHPECSGGCTGPSEYDCVACKNLMIAGNGTVKRCVDNCPITHYTDADTKLCLPCDENCFGCSGPRNTIAPDGCIRCSSALVNNDHSYTIVKCIQKDEFNCSDDHFFDLVPVNLKNHPLKGKTVCRQCHDECDGCYKNGPLLNTQCAACKNFYSKSTNECVGDCFYHNEYLQAGTNVMLC